MGIRNMKTVTVDGIIYKVPMDIKKQVMAIVAAWPAGSCAAESPVSESTKTAVGKATLGLTATVKDLRSEMKALKTKINKLPKKVKDKHFA